MPVLRILLVGSMVLAGCRPAWRHEPFHADKVSEGYVAADGDGEVTGLAAPMPSPERWLLLAGMREHYEVVAELQHAVIGGDLRGVKERATTFVESASVDEPSGEPDEHVLRMTTAARAAAEADDLEQAAAAVATMASACGSCHLARDVRPSLPPMPDVDQGKTQRAAMRRHAWAVDRMWEGLVVPSDDRWIQGTAMFSLAPGCERGDDAATRDERQRACHRAQAFGQRAHVTEDWSKRVEIHGRLLATCATCHGSAAAARDHSTRKE